MDPHHQPGLPGQGHEDQVSGGELSLLPAHQCNLRSLIVFLGPSFTDEVLKSMPVQKQTPAAQWAQFKAFVAIGDYNGHVGLGVKCSKEVVTAILMTIIIAKLSLIQVW